jgi:hypothetical protein
MAKHDDLHTPRDEAGVGPYVRAGVRLIPLREHTQLKLSEGEPDIRGWEVRTVSGREIGRVDELLVDATVDEVVMLQIDLPESDRHTLAPIRVAKLDRAHRVVLLDSAELHDESEIPSLAHGRELTDEEVRRFSEGYARAFGEPGRLEERDYIVRRGGRDVRFGRRSTDVVADAPAADVARPVDVAERADVADVTDAPLAAPLDAPRDGARAAGQPLPPPPPTTR